MPAEALMESAGVQGWQLLESLLPESLHGGTRSIVLFAGKGNNGGDALVIGRCAARAGWQVTGVIAASEESLGKLPAAHLRTLRTMDVPVFHWPEEQEAVRTASSNADLLVDGIAGSGVRGALRAPLDALAELISSQAAFRAAIDVPSGLGDTWEPEFPLVRAHLTLAMGLPQRSLYEPTSRMACGIIRVVDVPFPPALLSDESLPGEILDWSSSLQLRQQVLYLPAAAYKHSRGTLYVSAGHRGTLGAALLCAHAAQRSRAGLVHLVVDDPLYSAACAGAGPVLVHAASDWQQKQAHCDASLVGPGWGTGAGREILLARILAQFRRGVLDADALNLLGDHSSGRLGNGWVMTPHVGELARLLGASTSEVRCQFIDSAIECARRWGCVVVGKSQVVVVADSQGRYTVVDGMNPALGTAGSGDVLAGLIAGILCGGADPYDAARVGVLIHQRAGELARAELGLFAADALMPYVARLVDHGA